jgi:hypothetical protein
MFSGRGAVDFYRLHVLISSLKLEMKGLRLSRGTSALAVAKRETGLRTNDRNKHIERLQEMIDEAKQAITIVNEKEEV